MHVGRVTDNLFNDPDNKVIVFNTVVGECQSIQGEALKILGAIDTSSSMGIEIPA